MWWSGFRPPRTAAYAARHGLFLHRCSQDVLAVYEKPYDPAESVVCLDEKPSPSARTILVVWDKLNIHCRKSLTDCYGQDKGEPMWSRLTIHPTPKHGNWLNQAEIEISLYSRQCLG